MSKIKVFKAYGEKPKGNWNSFVRKEGFYSTAILFTDGSKSQIEYPGVNFITHINLN